MSLTDRARRKGPRFQGPEGMAGSGFVWTVRSKWTAAQADIDRGPQVSKISGTDSPEQLGIDTDSEFFDYTSHTAFLIADSND